MRRLILAVIAAAIVGAIILLPGRLGSAAIEQETTFLVPPGASLTAVAQKLEEEGLVTSADGFLLNARIFGRGDPVHAGEFMLTPDMDQGDILAAFQQGDVIRRFVTIPEGMPSIMVRERLMAQELLTGDVDIPPEGSVLPATYDFERGEPRQAVLERMQAAMTVYLAEAWEGRRADIAVSTPQEAVILASVVEKETGKPSERGKIAGLYSNRLNRGIRLQADPTIIYPITQGKPLGRRIRRSEIDAVNDYNTYTRDGLPAGPITNPGRESIAAVLNPERTDALFMVADGTGGHAFARTYEQHNANVAQWRQIRRERGEIE